TLGGALADNAVDVPISGPIQIAFSTPINSSTVNSSVVGLQASQGLHATNLQVSGNTVTVQPLGGLQPYSQYILSIGAQIRGTNKERRRQSWVGSFTAATGWTTPTSVGGGAYDGIPAKVALSDSGHAMVTWIEIVGYHEACEGSEGGPICFYYP